jgi:hypothetical protein
LTLGLGAFAPAHGILIFESTLDGAQEVPPNASTASGTATLTLNDAQDRLEILITLLGLDLDGAQTPGDPNDNVQGAHIHAAPAGVNGGVVFGFISPNSDLNGDLVVNAAAGTIFSAWDLVPPEGNGTTLAAQLPNLLSGGLYINVHTPVFPGGEIRGQITAVPEPTTLLLMGLGFAGLGFARRRRNA